MFLKKASIVSVLALAVGVSAAGALTAAAAPKTSAVQVAAASFIVNGVPAEIHSFVQSGRTLVSIRELSGKLGVRLQVGAKGYLKASLNGHLVELQTGSNVMKVDGSEQKLQVPVKAVGGTTYVELKAFVAALGGLFAMDKAGAIWIDADLLGSVDRIQWADASRIIASRETESGRVDYIVNAQTGKYAKLLEAEDASDLVVSPDGSKAAYTISTGEIFIVDLAAGTTSKKSADTSIKPELVWSADGKALYFLQGDKGSVIAKLDLETGAIAKVLEDKVDYKANLGVSADGKVFTYTVTKPGAVVADSNKPVEEDDVAIDMKGTEPQIFRFVADESIKDNKAAQLTTTSDDKVFVQAATDGGSVGYVSIGTEVDAISTLVTAGKDQTVKTLFADADINQAAYAAGKWYLLTAGQGAGQAIYEVDPATGSKKLLYTVSDTVTEIFVKAGSPIALMNNGKVYVDINGHWKPTTRE